MTEALLDNDVIIKACRYSLATETLSSLQNRGYEPAMLAAARFVVEDRLRRHAPAPSTAMAMFKQFLSGCRSIEPTDDEIEMATAFEEAAQNLNLELDAGESMLLAILLKRRAALLLTGDKRAIRAIEKMAPEIEQIVACLEQLFATLNADWSLQVVQAGVCADRTADPALTNAYGCRSGGSEIEAVAYGLRSYIEDLRRDCARILVAPQDLPRRVP
jgi:hypothetical protein